jgi:hypothetical protein
VGATGSDPIGGQETDLTAGLIRHLSSTLRVMTHYVNVLEVDWPGSVFNGNTMSFFKARCRLGIAVSCAMATVVWAVQRVSMVVATI